MRRVGFFLSWSWVDHERGTARSTAAICCSMMVAGYAVQAANLAHELGHVRGLDHSGRGLRDPMMGSVPIFGRPARSVSDSECAAAGFRWLSNAELAQQRRDPVE